MVQVLKADRGRKISVMKIAGIVGYSNTGKTTVIENIIKELKKRGRSCAVIKNVHCSIQIDKNGTDTQRHINAGAEMSAAWGRDETVVFYNRRIRLVNIVGKSNYDYLLLEGCSDMLLPKIVTAKDIESLEAKLDKHTIAISGVIAGEMTRYKRLPVLNCNNQIEKLVDLVEKNAEVYKNNFCC